MLAGRIAQGLRQAGMAVDAVHRAGRGPRPLSLTRKEFGAPPLIETVVGKGYRM